MSDCPSIAALEAYLAKGCSDEAALHHIDQCAQCAARLREIEVDNAFLIEISRTVAARSVESSGSGVSRAATGSGDPPVEKSFRQSLSASGMESVPGYEIRRVIGRGGQAVVYEALQLSTKRRVALKVMLYGASRETAETSRNPELLKPSERSANSQNSGPHPIRNLPRTGRFAREVRLVAQLRHHGIVTVFDSGTTTDGRPYFAMEYIDGKSIHDWAQSADEKPPAIRTVVQLLVSICEAVRYAHQRGVIHRDLKPSNILVDGDGTPRVLDFGLAKMDDSHASLQLTVSGQFLGTLAYAAPEQLRGEPHLADTRTDVYALGVILYELLTGRPLLALEGSFSQIVRTITDREPARPSIVRAEIDDELEMIVLMAIAKDPDRRYENAGALLEDLQRYLAGEPVAAKRDSGWYILRKTVRRHRLPVLVIAGFVILSVAYGVTMSLLYGLASGRETEARLAAEQLSNELDSAQIDRGRGLASSTRAAIGHELIWKTHLGRHPQHPPRAPIRTSADPIERQAYWALHEMYQHHPIRHRTLFQSSVYAIHVGETPLVARLENSEKGRRLGVERFATDLGGEPTLLWTYSEPVRPGDMNVQGFTPDGRHLICGRANNCIIFDAMTGKIVFDCPLGSKSYVLAIEPNARWFARIPFDARDCIEIWDVEQSTKARTLLQYPNRRFAMAESKTQIADPPWRNPNSKLSFDHLQISADGNRIMAATQIGTARPTIFIWSPDDPTPRVLFWLDVAPLPNLSSYLSGLCISDDGTRVGTVFGGAVDVWQVPHSAFNKQEVVSSQLSVESDPSLLATDNWQPTPLQHLTRLPITSGWHATCFFNRDGSQMALLSEDHLLRIMDVDRGVLLGTLAGHAYQPRRGLFTADRRWLYTVDQKTVLMWDLTNLGGPKPQQFLNNPGFTTHGVCFSPSGTSNLLASCGADLRSDPLRGKGAIHLWNVMTGERQGTLIGHEYVVSHVAFTNDGAILASCSFDGSLRLWDVRDSAAAGEILRVDAPQQLNQLAFNPDNSLVAAACDDGAVYVWNVSDGSIVATLHHVDANAVREIRRLPCVAFNSDGNTIASGSVNSTVKLWNLQDGRSRTLTGHEDTVRAVAFSPDGKLLASGGDDWTLRLWDAKTGAMRHALRGQTSRIFALRFSPDGTVLAVAGADGRIVFWDPHVGRQLLTLDANDATCMSLDFSPDGNQFAASYLYGPVKIWDLRRFDSHIESNRIWK